MSACIIDPVTIPTPKLEWRGGPRAIGMSGRDPGFMVGKNQDSRVPRRVALYDPIPGYTGRNARMPTEASWNNGRTRHNRDMPFSTDDAYLKASPRIKTNSKNISAFAMGDNRCRYWNTTNQDLIQLPDGYEESCGQSIVEGWEDMTEDERKAIYARAISHVGMPGVTLMFEMVRAKIEQRTTGGPFVLRQAFKLFDRDSSGDIDPDEFYGAMEWMGLQFTERQVLALFGACDDDGGGSLDYFEFIEKVLDGIACRPQSAAKRKVPKQVHQYRQQLALCDMFKQLDNLDNGAPFEVERDVIKELLAMANVPKCSYQILESYVDLVERVIQMLVAGAVTKETFWQWWSGDEKIPGVPDFPVANNSLAIVQPSLRQQATFKPCPPPGASPNLRVPGGQNSIRMHQPVPPGSTKGSSTHRHHRPEPPTVPANLISNGAVTSRLRYNQEAQPFLPRLNTGLRRSVRGGANTHRGRGGYALASNPL